MFESATQASASIASLELKPARRSPSVLGPLRDQILRDLGLRGYANNTKRAYLRCVTTFATHFMDSPTELGATEIRLFLEHLVAVKRTSRASIKMHLAALTFLYKTTLCRPNEMAAIHHTKVPRRSDIPSRDEVAVLLPAIGPLECRIVALLVCDTGLRVADVCALRVDEIDLAEGYLRVRLKIGAVRFLQIGRALLPLVRNYCVVRPGGGPYLFPSGSADRHLAPRVVRRAIQRAAVAVGILKRVYPDMLRHVLAGQLLEVEAGHGRGEVLLGRKSFEQAIGLS
jgi:integrase/recombinase XerD